MNATSDLQSPYYLIDETRLKENLELIQKVSDESGAEIILAFKGFAMWSVFPLIKKYVSGATASSLNEALLCSEKMGSLAHTYCVAFDDFDFDQIVTLSSHITFNSISQFTKFVGQVPSDKSIGLRVNPGWSDVETDLYNPSSPTSRLGLEASELVSLPERVEGLHFHVLCESDSHALEKVLDNFVEKFGHLLNDVKWVNFGGGHLMTRKGYDVDHLVRLLANFQSNHGVRVILEPGSAFAWQTGDLVTRVLDIVENGQVRTAIIDASFTCHMPDCLEMPYRPEIVGAVSESAAEMNSYRIGGVSCLAGDFLYEYWFDKELKVGDQLIFKDMIHYTMVKTTMFNGVRHPSIAIRKSNGGIELVREFDYGDYKSRLS